MFTEDIIFRLECAVRSTREAHDYIDLLPIELTKDMSTEGLFRRIFQGLDKAEEGILKLKEYYERN